MSTNYHSTKTIPTIPKTLNRTISPIITGHRKQGLTYLLGGQGRHMWLTGWWYVSLVLQDIAMRNLHDINRGRYLILLPWRFPGSQVFMLATYIANSVLPVSPSPTYFHTDTTKELPTSNNTPLTRTGSSIPIPLPQLLPLGRRHLVPSPPPNLPFFFARDTSIQSIKMALRI